MIIGEFADRKAVPHYLGRMDNSTKSILKTVNLKLKLYEQTKTD